MIGKLSASIRTTNDLKYLLPPFGGISCTGGATYVPRLILLKQ
jgi:hypothetical protein